MQWTCSMLHGVGSQKTEIFRVFFMFSKTSLLALWPTQLSVHCVQLFFDGDQSGQGLNLTNRLSPLSSPKFIFNFAEHDFSIVRSTTSFRRKIKKKNSLCVTKWCLFLILWAVKNCRYLLHIDWLKYPENTLTATSGFCKCGHENTGFDKLQKCQIFKKIFIYFILFYLFSYLLQLGCYPVHAPWSVCLLRGHVCLEGRSVDFSVFFIMAFSPTQAIFCSIESRAIDGNSFAWFDLN